MHKNGEEKNLNLTAVIRIIAYIKTIKTPLLKFKLIEVDEKVEYIQKKK